MIATSSGKHPMLNLQTTFSMGRTVEGREKLVSELIKIRGVMQDFDETHPLLNFCKKLESSIVQGLEQWPPIHGHY